MKNTVRALIVGLGLSAILFAPSSIASLITGTAATTGLLSLTPGHVAILTLADVGTANDVVTPAQLEIIDGENRVLATSRGELRSGQPLELEFRHDGSIGPRLPVRARVTVFGTDDRLPRQFRAKPILTFELLSVETGDVNVGFTCKFPGGGVEFMGGCGCVVTDLTFPPPPVP